MRYIIVDRQTGYQIGGTYTNKARANRRVDQLDNAYGAYRYTVRVITPTESSSD